jgi:colanic acid biosynthesis glycosyl transferase WcaI
MARFLVLSQVFRPDAVSTAQVMADLAEDLAAAGHDVSVLTTTPHYNPGIEAGTWPALGWWWIPVVKRSRRGGVRVWHVVMPDRRTHLLARLVAWAWYHLVSTLVGAGLRRADAILVCSPPLTIGISAWVLSLVHRAPFVYNVQELYPDIAVRLGVFRPGRLLTGLYGLERFVYRRAARVVAISRGMRQRVLEKGVPADKALFIPNFVDLATLKPSPADNAFAREHALTGRFVVSYAGNLGLAQGMETILDAAAILRDDERVRFVIMGDGLLRRTLAERVAGEALTNVLLLPYQPYERMSEVYSRSDLNLVPLAADTGADALPSKIYRILACEGPILAIADEESDLASFVIESRCGIVVAPGNPRALAAAITAELAAARRRRAEVRERAPHAVAPYSREAITASYRRLLEELAAARAC